MNRWLMIAGVAAGVSLGVNQGLAQNNGGQGGAGGGFGRFRNMTPEERQQMMMDRAKQELEVTDDAEWKAIQPMVQKVMDARMALASVSGGGRMFGFGPRNRGGDQGGGGDQGNQRPRGGFFGQQQSPEVDALNKAVEAKAPKAEIKAALAKVIEVRKAKQADLEKAQDDLRKVLTSRQEAIAVLNGWL